MSERMRIGLVGAGPWAQVFTGPMLSASQDADLVGIWARRLDAAQALATNLGTTAVEDLDALIDRCDALCFSVPPSVQADLAARAARAGRSVLLDKPVGATVAQAEGLAQSITEAGVVSQMILTNRYFGAMRSFLAEAAAFDAYGGRAAFFGNGSVEGSFFGTPWRLSEGGLLDLGPHVLDALDAALGPIVAVEARGDTHRLVLLECAHDGGAVSQAALSATTDQSGGLMVELHGPAGRVAFDSSAFTPEQAATEFATAQRRIVGEFAGCVRSGTTHLLDVHRGVHLQRIIDSAAAQLRR